MLGPGISSESIWTPFSSLCTATIRPIRARLLVAWTRVVGEQNFSIVGSSVVGGIDIVQGVGDVAINDSDYFMYFDETSRVIRLEYERHLLEPLGGLSMAMADIVLDNSDLRFTPDYNATIGTALRPNRPIKMFVGFDVQDQTKTIPIIEGLTRQPKEDKANRTVTITVYDFLKSLNEQPLESAIYTEQRSDQIIADVLSDAGIGASKYELDQGLNTVGFAWFEKGQTAGERIRLLCEAEEAIFFQDELGMLRFENRDKYSASPYDAVVWTIEPSDILGWKQDFSSQIINRVIIKGKPRSVKGETEIWRDGIEEEIPATGSLTIWAEFEDPVSDITQPASATDYEAHAAPNGAGADITADISIVMTEFTKAAKLVITNANAGIAYMNLLKLRGTPATIDYEIKEVFQDDTSIVDYSEQQKEIENPFIDKTAFAKNMAQNITRRHKNPTSVIRVKIRGVPQLQLRDRIKVRDQDLNTYTEYRLIGIQGVFEAGSFTQTLRLRKITSAEAN